MSTISTTELADLGVGVLAAQIPGAARLFRKYRIDFCCGGKGTVKDSVDGAFVTESQVLKELELLLSSGEQIVWENRSTADLIQYILDRFHQGHREELPELILLSKKVEAVHGDHPLAPKGLARALKGMLDSMEEHMAKEEEVLFPAMMGADHGCPIDGAILQMRHEHHEHGQKLDILALCCHDFELPPEACATWQALYTGVQNLIQEVMNHVTLENHILFERFPA